MSSFAPEPILVFASPLTPPPPADPFAPLDLCARLDDPGLGQDHPEWIDYSALPFRTPDQARIEAVLAATDLSAAALLHVGIGNSLLAQRFAGRCAALDGITISPAELAHAAALGIADYRPLLANKYSVALPALLGRTYDLIVDNNPASFACCAFHLLVMFSSYRLLLRPGGALLTDQQGMDWVVGDPRWRWSFADLERVGRRVGLRAQRVNASVYALFRP